MLIILLKEIQDSSETAITYLVDQLETLKISDIQGEDVKEFVTTIRSTYDTLVSASTESHDYVPSNFCKTVITILQTSSVPEFNEIFEDELKQITRKASRYGGLPKYPPVEEMLSLALNTYRTMSRAPSTWTTSKPGSYCQSTGTTKPSGLTAVPFYKKPGYKCDNCEQPTPDHALKDCPQTRDNDRIKKNQAARKARKKKDKKPKNQPPSGYQKPRWTPKAGPNKGRPHILNKKGVYVIDVKRENELAELAKKDTVISKVKTYYSQQTGHSEASAQEEEVTLDSIHSCIATL